MKRLPFSFYIQVLICAALWGSAFPVIKISFTQLNLVSFREQLIFAGSRFLLAGLLVLPFCRRNIVKSVRKAPPGMLLAIILGQTYFQYVFFYYGLRVSSGTLGALLVGTGSFWWIVLGPILIKTSPPRPIHWVLLVFCSIGICLAVYAPGAGSGNVLLGTIAFLCASFSGAVAAIFMKRVAPISGSRTVTSFSLTCGGILLLLTAVPEWSRYLEHFTLTTLWVTCYLAFLSATAFTIWNRLIERYSINTLSTYRFLIPLFGVLESTLFIPSERIGLGIVAGGSIILIGIIAISRIPEPE
jgi:drug/metabolite transporter (DMT)-like permease